MAVSQADLDASLSAAGPAPSDGAAPSSADAAAARRTDRTGAVGSDFAAELADPLSANPDLERLLHLQVPISVRLAERDMSVESILQLTVGSVLEFDRSADSELDLVVTGQTIGAGEAVKIGENFGLRITRIGTRYDRIRALGR